MTEPLPFRVGDTTGRGLGVYATRAIALGELIISEDPIVASLLNAESEELAISLLSEEDKAVFFSFVDQHHPGNPTIEGIFKSNAVPTNRPGTGGMYANICRTNHSCTPNAAYSPSDTSDRENIYAYTDIAEGAEILTSYIPLWRSREHRQEHLSTGFKFTCACTACAGPPNPVSDALREEVHRLGQAMKESGMINPAETLRSLNARLRLVEEEGTHDLGIRCEDRLYASQIAASCSDYETSRRHAGQAYALSLLGRGRECADTVYLLRLHRYPRAHDSAGMDEEPLPALCDGCGKEEMGGFKGKAAKGGGCGSCNCALYCSRSCKLAHAALHKPICEVIQRSKSEVVSEADAFRDKYRDGKAQDECAIQ